MCGSKEVLSREGHDALQTQRQPKEKGKEKAADRQGDVAPKTVDGDSDSKSEPMDLEREGSVDSSRSAKRARELPKKKHPSTSGVASGLVRLGVSSEGRIQKRRLDEGSSRSSGEYRRTGEKERGAFGNHAMKLRPPTPSRPESEISAAATAVIERLTSGAPSGSPHPASAPASLQSPSTAGWNRLPPGYPYNGNPYRQPPPPPAMHGYPYPNFASHPPQFQPPPNYVPYPRHWHQPPPLATPPQPPAFIPAGQHSQPISSQRAFTSHGQATSSRYGDAGRDNSVQRHPPIGDRRKRERSPDDYHGEGDANNKKRKAVVSGMKGGELGSHPTNGVSTSSGELGSVSRPHQRTNVELLYGTSCKCISHEARRLIHVAPIIDYCKTEKMDSSKLPCLLR